MEMGAELRKRRQPPCSLCGDDPRLQRPQSDPFQPAYLMNPFCQLRQPAVPIISGLQPSLLSFSFRACHTLRFLSALPEINPVGTDVDTREHHFPVTGFYKSPHLFQDILHSAAPDPSPGIGNGAVRAELVAAVLNLDIGPGMPGCAFQPHLFILIGMADIRHRRSMQRLVPLPLLISSLPFLQIFRQNGRDILLPVVADGQVDGRILLHRIPARLHVAAHRHHHRVRIELPGPVQHLPALPVGNVGDRTCVHDIDIGSFIKCHNAKSFFLKDLAHYIHFIRIDLAAQIIQCHSFHDYSPLFCTVFALTFAPPAVNMLTGR